MDCFKKDMRPLNMATVALKGFNNSNCKQHMNSQHKEDLWGKQFRMYLEEEEGGVSSQLSKGGFFSTKSVAEESQSTCAVVPHAFAKTKIPKLIVQRGNDLQLQFMRSCNMAACHGSSPELRSYLEHIVDNAAYYSKNKGHLVMGRHKISNQRYKSFNQLVSVVKMMVGRTRDWLLEKTKRKTIPFLTVGHDGWDSKDRDMIGVCVHFVDIIKGTKRTLALGLQQSPTKSSEPNAELIMKMLERLVLHLCCCVAVSLLSDLFQLSHTNYLLQV
jgi:hypothetical protein